MEMAEFIRSLEHEVEYAALKLTELGNARQDLERRIDDLTEVIAPARALLRCLRQWHGRDF
jgi:hypothetical protein